MYVVKSLKLSPDIVCALVSGENQEGLECPEGKFSSLCVLQNKLPWSNNPPNYRGLKQCLITPEEQMPGP